MVRTTLLVGAVKDFGVIVINSVSGEYIGDEFSRLRTFDTSLSNKGRAYGVFNLSFLRESTAIENRGQDR